MLINGLWKKEELRVKTKLIIDFENEVDQIKGFQLDWW